MTLAYYKEKYDETYATYQATYDVYAASNWGPTYYTFQYVLGGTLSMYEATADLVYLERALAWVETMISKATIIDIHSKKNWAGQWASPYSGSNIAYLLDDAQASTEMARLARIIISTPALNTAYGSRAEDIYEFVRDHLVDKALYSRSQLSWHLAKAADTSVVFNDKNSLIVSTMADLLEANAVLGTSDSVQSGYAAIIEDLTDYFKARMVPAGGDAACDCFGITTDALIWDCGDSDYQLPNHANDTSHSNREASMIMELYELGHFDLSHVQGAAQLLNDIIWNQSLTSPAFTNHIDGNNDPNLGKGAYGLGLIYSGWVKLAKYDADVLAISDATLRKIIDGVSNASLDAMDNLHGRAALAGHLARAVAGTPPAPSAITADGFNAGSLSTALWEVVDPLGDATVTMTGTQLSVAITGGVKHNMWTDDKNGVRILQQAPDVDFVLKAKIDTLPSARYHDIGIYAEEDADNNIRIAILHNGTTVNASAVKLTSGTASTIASTAITLTAPFCLRLTRVGDAWTGEYSQDGISWTPHFSSHSHAINVAKVGLVVLNSHETASMTPAITALFDTFGLPTVPGHIVTPADVDAYPVTMAAWIRQDSAAAGTVCSLNLSSAANKYFALAVNGSGEPVVLRSNTTLITTTATGADVADGDWHHVLAVLHDATTVSIFVDAVAIVDEATVTSVTLDAGAADQFTLAATETSTGSGYFTGDLADVQLRDAVLDVNDALELMALADIERSITQPAGYSGIKLDLRGSGDITIGWGDGTYDDYTLSGTSTFPEHTYAGTAGYTVSFLGSGQITQLRGAGTNDQTRWGGDVAYLPRELTYLSVAGSNTISGALSGLPSGVTTVSIQGNNTITGALSGFPSGVTTVGIQGSNTISGNVSGLPSSVTSVNIFGSNTISGDLSGLPSGLTSTIIAGSNTITGALSGLPSGVTSVQIYGSNTISGNVSGLPSGMTIIVITGSNTITVDTITAALRIVDIYNLAQTSVDNAIKQAWTHRNTGGTRSYTLNGGTASAPKDTMAALRDALVAGSLGNTVNTITIKTPAIETDDELTYSQIVGAAPLVGFYPTGDAASDAAIASASTVLMGGPATAGEVSILIPALIRAGWTTGADLNRGLVTSEYAGGAPDEAAQVKAGLLTASGGLKPGLLTAAGELKPSILKSTAP